jgi:hypothetical protein
MSRRKPQKKMSDIMKEMAELILSKPADHVSDEAAHVALFLASTAWNNLKRADGRKCPYASVIRKIAGKRNIWLDLKSSDPAALISKLEEFAAARYPGDRREIVICGTTPRGTIRVEWIERDPRPPGPKAVNAASY